MLVVGALGFDCVLELSPEPLPSCGHGPWCDDDAAGAAGAVAAGAADGVDVEDDEELAALASDAPPATMPAAARPPMTVLRIFMVSIVVVPPW